MIWSSGGDDVLGISRGHVLKVLDLLHEEGWTLTHSPSPSGTNGKAAYTAVGAAETTLGG